MPGAERRRDRVQSVGDGRGALASICGSSSSRPTRSPTATSSARSTASASRPRGASASSTARATSAIRAARSSPTASRDKDEIVVADLDLGHDPRGAEHLAVLPRSPAGDVRRDHGDVSPPASTARLPHAHPEELHRRRSGASPRAARSSTTSTRPTPPRSWPRRPRRPRPRRREAVRGGGPRVRGLAQHAGARCAARSCSASSGGWRSASRSSPKR